MTRSKNKDAQAVECCVECRYYKPLTIVEGFCRYSPPTAAKGFPIVPYDNWCGGFKEQE